MSQKFGENLPVVILAVCPNVDHFHESAYVQYIVYGKGQIIVMPTNSEYEAIKVEYEEYDFEVIYVICSYCYKHGAKGVSNFYFSPHPFDVDIDKLGESEGDAQDEQ